MADVANPLTLATEKYGNMTIGHAAKLATDPASKALLMQMARRIKSAEPEMVRFREWANRADQLYYAEHITQGGADLWWDHPSATTPGAAHVSVNTPAPIVDIPAALQAVEPIENMLATDTTQAARSAAASLERVYTAWKMEEGYELKWHKAATVKALYGRTAARIYWDDGDGGESPRPCIEIIEQPRNLYMGYKTDSYDELEWAAYVQRMDPNAIMETYGVDVTLIRDETTGMSLPYVTAREDPYESDWSLPRPWLEFGNAMVEVWDYWYRMPLWRRGKYVGMVTYNVVVCGNYVLRGPTKYTEYDGKLPYVPLFNTFIPGVPNGRPELYDAEQLIREKFEKITAGSQMIANAVAGDYWQLVGENAGRVPPGLKPKRNELVGPGPGNRIEVITPFIAQFQLEQYLGRLDRELAVVTGLNDLLLGLAPAQSLNSSKAINALIANYETRLSMRRKLFYKWRADIWSLALTIWVHEEKHIAQLVKDGGGRLDILDPSLSPKDDMETAQRALNLVSGKLWSQRRAMDAVGVDDPETEMDLIREESTDAALWPERVQVMAQLLGALQSLQLPAPGSATQQAQGQMASSQETLRQALQGQTAKNSTGMQSPDTQGMTPPIPGAPPEAGGQPFATPPQPAEMQSMVQGGKVKGRILTTRKAGTGVTLGRR